MKHEYLIPSWPAPKNIQAVVTTRHSGYSTGNYSSFNLAAHVEDNPDHVAQNREKLVYDLNLKNPPQWLQQIHSNQVVTLHDDRSQLQPSGRHRRLDRDFWLRNIATADAAVTQQIELVCAILSADCLPILLCNQQGNEIAAIHAGWRGLLNGVIDNTVKAMQSPPSQWIAWLGPAIGPEVFELSNEIKVAFNEQDAQNMYSFIPSVKDRWFGDIYQLARNNLRRCGIDTVFGGNFCTYTDQDRFYSYRRDQGTTGRMASLIWINKFE